MTDDDLTNRAHRSGLTRGRSVGHFPPEQPARSAQLWDREFMNMSIGPRPIADQLEQAW
ncbi:hypothetical protein ACODT3_41290 [Streptomyces sp. 4.24]|uniref:hypothetical protein n=1 Tax=Streptomyces tritrimontium TaxID=3406573 RepID=UPI003BB4E160